MKWVTRERPKIDRIACPWLIARFIDRQAEFLYVPADQVLEVAQATGAIPYDIPGVEYGHHGELCSFDAFMDKHDLTDPALRQLVVIVRGADTDRHDLARSAPVWWPSPWVCRATTPMTTRCSGTAWLSTTPSTPGCNRPRASGTTGKPWPEGASSRAQLGRRAGRRRHDGSSNMQ